MELPTLQNKVLLKTSHPLFKEEWLTFRSRSEISALIKYFTFASNVLIWVRSQSVLSSWMIADMIVKLAFKTCANILLMTPYHMVTAARIRFVSVKNLEEMVRKVLKLFL
jgi:hypothetical protein